MLQIGLAVGMAAAVIAVGVPFAAIILVSIASRREEAAHSLTRHAPGAAARAARRLLRFRTKRIAPPPDWAAANYPISPARERRSLRPASTPPRMDLVREARSDELAPVPDGQQHIERIF